MGQEKTEKVPGGSRKDRSLSLQKLMEGQAFPASKEEVIRRLAVEADAQGGGRAAELHDLVVQLERTGFRNMEDLEKAVKERDAWETAHPYRK